MRHKEIKNGERKRGEVEIERERDKARPDEYKGKRRTFIIHLILAKFIESYIRWQLDEL